MPTVAVDKEDLFNSLGRYYSTQEFDELCFDFGIELDEDTSLEELPAGERPQLKIEVPANRYDLLCYEGIARALNIFLGRGEIPNYTLITSSKPEQIVVKPETSQIRQFISGAILRNIKFDERRYESFIALQDKLHSNICRNRTLVSVGTHDLDTIEGPFTYEALKPQDIVFAPLNQDKVMNGEQLMEFYQHDKHLGRFLHIIRDSPVYPVVLDAKRRVCSLPPIINSNLSKITLDTKNVLIEVTATDKTKMEIVTNQIVAMFSEYCADAFTVEPIDIISPHNHESRLAPQIEPRHMNASAKYINSVCGFEPQSREKLASLIHRMGLIAVPSKSQQDLLDIDIPCTRSDILHACDIVEDAAIGYGYNNLPKTFPDKSSTIGNALGINKVSDIVRQEVAQAGWLEVMTLTLCSHNENFAFLNLEDDGTSAVKLANPKTTEYQVVRTNLLPGLLKTVRENLSHRLPMQIFETGDVVLKDDKLERKAYNSRRLGAVIAGKTSGFEIVHGLLDRVLAMLRVGFVSQPPKENQETSGKIYWIQQAQDMPTYFPGRAANVFVKLGPTAPIYKIGSFGVLHPSVMSKFEIPLAASSLEIDLQVFL